MPKIHLIRHGESIANTQGRYQGQTYDTDLSPLGEKQVAALKTRFSKTTFDGVFASPLKRTRQTAAALISKNHQIIFTRQLLETNHGQWEGKTSREIKVLWPEMYDLWLTNPSQVAFPMGETFGETFFRSVNWLNSLKNRQGTFAAVTHSNIIFAILSHVLGRPLDTMWDFAVQPTSVSTLSFDGKNWVSESICDDTHLTSLESNLKLHAI